MHPYRSMLFVPVTNDRALAKSVFMQSDAVILDLEDSVPVERKEEARAIAVKVLDVGGFSAPYQLVRVNAVDTEFFQSDVKALAKAGAQAILVPKVENVEDIQAAAAILDADPNANSTQIWFMIESALGVMNLREICAASPRLAGMIIGPNDLIKDLRAKDTAGQEALLTSYAMCLLAARAFGLACIDGVYKEFKNTEGFADNCAQGRILGFDGKSLIHPAQIAPANEAFGPSPEDIDLAKRQIEAFDAAMAEGKGVAVVDGAMVEGLHVDIARKLLKMATMIAEREEN